MKEKRTITQRIKIDIYKIWDNEKNGVVKARDLLKKMYLQEFNSLTDIEEKRLILHDLTTAEITIGTEASMSSAKYYSKTLKDMLDDYPNYINDEKNQEKYCKALNNYTECYRDEINRDELIDIYEFIYETYKGSESSNVEAYLEKLVAQFNLNLLKRNFNIILEVIEDILHNNKNSQYEEALESFMQYIENTDDTLYRQALLLIQNEKIKVS